MFKLIFKQLKKKEWLLMVLIVALICGQVYLELLIPDYMSEITRLVQVETGTLNGILIAGAKMLVCAITSTILASVTGFIVARISSSVSMRLRSEIFSKVQSF